MNLPLNLLQHYRCKRKNQFFLIPPVTLICQILLTKK
uniref:Uncharacterized protein n=1 Tax=Podoviridae sp. ct8Lf7 TaxID=2827723 RepID=A0A8S5S155_9CAUD|nr:MAG TPA: hypothetical protein [Podoviridae sp. ct8Lf7]